MFSFFEVQTSNEAFRWTHNLTDGEIQLYFASDRRFGFFYHCSKSKKQQKRGFLWKRHNKESQHELIRLERLKNDSTFVDVSIKITFWVTFEGLAEAAKRKICSEYFRLFGIEVVGWVCRERRRRHDLDLFPRATVRLDCCCRWTTKSNFELGPIPLGLSPSRSSSSSSSTVEEKEKNTWLGFCSRDSRNATTTTTTTFEAT